MAEDLWDYGNYPERVPARALDKTIPDIFAKIGVLIQNFTTNDIHPIPDDGYEYALFDFLMTSSWSLDRHAWHGPLLYLGGYSANQAGTDPIWICSAYSEEYCILQPCQNIMPRFKYPQSLCVRAINTSNNAFWCLRTIHVYKYKIE